MPLARHEEGWPPQERMSFPRDWGASIGIRGDVPALRLREARLACGVLLCARGTSAAPVRTDYRDKRRRRLGID